MNLVKAGLRVFLALLTLVAIASQLLIHIRLGADVVNFFSYFTNLSNLLAAAVFLASAGFRSALPWTDRVRAFSATNMAVVGIVFTLLLRNQDLGALQPWVNFVLHDLMPCAVVLDWLLDPPSTRLGAGDPGRFLIFPAVYLVYSLIRGAQVSWYPYPFLNPDHVGGYGGVAIYAVGITLIFVVVGSILLAIGNRLGRTVRVG
jgi:hypothetical protein